MIALLQRVSEARVTVQGLVVGEIGTGLLVFVGVEAGDSVEEADRLLDRVIGYRIFPDVDGRMNLALRDIAGGLLLVPQFTLAANTNKGLRPSFTSAAPPESGERLFDHTVSRARETLGARVATGRFGAHMLVSLTNDGPVTFWLQVPAANRKA